jgi:hypothetical protein
MRAKVYITGETKSDAVFRALEGCQRGDLVVYHVGPHCGGVHRFSALSASQRGMCLLFCKKVGDGVFEYMAMKRW